MLRKSLGLLSICVVLSSAAIQSACADEEIEISAKELKSVNISVQPLGLLFGIANVAAEFGVSDSIAVGPSVSYFTVSAGSTTVSTLGYGISADFFLGHKRFTDGWLGTLGLDFAQASAASLSASGVGGQAQFGYGWFWNSGFNIITQLGIGYSSARIESYPVSAVMPSFGFQLGWAI